MSLGNNSRIYNVIITKNLAEYGQGFSNFYINLSGAIQ
jgi:hypothetical protein